MYDRIMEDFLDFLTKDETEFKHYGVGHLDGGHSGRYPWLSGVRPGQRDPKVQAEIEKAKNLSSGSSHNERQEDDNEKKRSKCINQLESYVLEAQRYFLGKELGLKSYASECESINTNITMLGMRDRLYGNGTIWKENFNDKSYVALVNVRNNTVPVLTKLDGGKMYIAATAQEGLIKQHLANKAVKKVKKLMNE